MKPKVVLTQWVHSDVLALLEKTCEVVPNPTRETLTRDEIIARMNGASAMMAFMPDRIDENFLQACPDVRIIAGALKGYDNFDVEACTRHGVWLTVVPDLLTVPTAELALGLLLGVTRHLHEGDSFIRQGTYSGWRPQFYGTGLTGRTLGIVGMGAVGQALARRLSGFDLRLVYHDIRELEPATARQLNVQRVTFDELLTASDIVVPLVHLTETTFHLFDAKTLSRMKAGAVLLNVGRGSIVDEHAVAAAIAAGWLSGYAADVFEMEDWARSDHPQRIPQALLDDPAHTFFTPHLGTAIHEVRRAIELEAAQNILAVLCGDEPTGAVNRPVSEKRI